MYCTVLYKIIKSKYLGANLGCKNRIVVNFVLNSLEKVKYQEFRTRFAGSDI